ncbi:MAG: NmrA family NAD(P)-binding protein [Myxococcota bacterium]
MVSRILITAALGNVGGEVARACAARGLAMRVADRDASALRARLPDHEAAALDFLDRATWPAALEGCDRVFLLRPPPIGDMEATLLPFVDAAYAAGVEHIVFLSVAGAERMKWVPHRKVELHLMARGKGFTLLRPGFFAQNLKDAYRRDIVEDGRLYVPAAEGRVAFLDVRDVGDVAARVFDEPARFRGQALTLTGPEALTFREVAALLSQRLGRTIAYQPAGILGYARHLRRKRGMPWTQIVVQTILHVGLRRGDAERVEPTVEALLGRPPGSLGEYVDRALDTWQPGGTLA